MGVVSYCSGIIGWYEGATGWTLGALIDALYEGLRDTIVYGNSVLWFWFITDGSIKGYAFYGSTVFTITFYPGATVVGIEIIFLFLFILFLDFPWFIKLPVVLLWITYLLSITLFDTGLWTNELVCFYFKAYSRFLVIY